MDQRLQELAFKLKEELTEKLGEVEVVVFGSSARGENLPDSDLDICVIADPADRATREIVFEAAWEVGFPAGVVIVPLVFSREELKGVMGSSPIFKSLEREGVRV